ncbi:MAG: thioredoxin family protein [Desulfobacterales bacterium]|nr:thioredoxin family protein [Desulfobacterales bacterium]MDJ0855491.1 thioredoxin family protein [Desulfobacterales bacterium]MDJ0886010.1 thioredoxin family protein [Desulfobacterales bacterium]
MKKEDLECIQNHPGRRAAGMSLTLILTRDDRSGTLETFVQTLEAHWPALVVERTRADDDGPPFLELGDGLRFQGLPENTKLSPFLDILAGEVAPPPEAQHAILNRMALGEELRLYVAALCPHCPKAFRQWAALALAGPNLRVRIVDGSLFPEEAARDGVQAVPTLVMNGDWRWSGNIPVHDVLRQLADRDPSQLSAAALEGLVKEGRAAKLAEAMQSHGSVFPAFVDLLTHAKWPVRLGAMVAMEALIESDPELARTAVPLVMARFDALDDQAKGDALYILGEAGDHETLAQLRTLTLDGAGAELHQAAREAAESITARLGAAERRPT